MAEILGSIDCPHCGESMKVKTDKNGEPFGHCEHCSGQLRVGGNALRVANFYRKWPGLKQPGAEAAPPTQEQKAAAPAPNKAPAPKYNKPGFSFFENALKQVAP